MRYTYDDVHFPTLLGMSLSMEESLLTSARRVDPKTEPGMSSGQDEDLSSEGCFRLTFGVNVSLRMYLLLTFFNAISFLEAETSFNFLQ